jgi:hypothetical protein
LICFLVMSHSAHYCMLHICRPAYEIVLEAQPLITNSQIFICNLDIGETLQLKIPWH